MRHDPPKHAQLGQYLTFIGALLLLAALVGIGDAIIMRAGDTRRPQMAESAMTLLWAVALLFLGVRLYPRGLSEFVAYVSSARGIRRILMGILLLAAFTALFLYRMGSALH